MICTLNIIFVSETLSSRNKGYFFLIPESSSRSPSGSMYGLFVMYPEVAHSSEGDRVQHQLSLAFPVFGPSCYRNLF